MTDKLKRQIGKAERLAKAVGGAKGGSAKVKKGLAALSPERRAEIRAQAQAAREAKMKENDK